MKKEGSVPDFSNDDTLKLLAFRGQREESQDSEESSEESIAKNSRHLSQHRQSLN